MAEKYTSKKIISPFFKKVKKSAGRFKRLFLSFINCKISYLIDFFFRNRPTANRLNPNISIAISTTKKYAPKTIPLLIENLKNVGIKMEAVYVFEGGHDSNRKIFDKDYHHYFLDNNSFDLTALIGIIELKLTNEYWLLLHDTVLLKPGFKNILNALNPVNNECMPLKESPSMNIGVYSKKYLEKNKDYLLSFSNKDYSNKGLFNAKERACKEEDYLFNNSKYKENINKQFSKFEYVKVVKYFNELRLLEGYPQLSLIKYKANGSALVMKDYPKIAALNSDVPDSLERSSWKIDL